MIAVRRASRADVGFLSRAESVCFSDPWHESALESHLAADGSLALVCELDGVPAGYLLAMLCPPEGEIYRVAVLPDARRAGIGRLLIEEALRTPGVTEWFLDVRESNAAARALYAKTGFTECGIRRDYYRAPRENAILMEKK